MGWCWRSTVRLALAQPWLSRWLLRVQPMLLAPESLAWQQALESAWQRQVLQQLVWPLVLQPVWQRQVWRLVLQPV